MSRAVNVMGTHTSNFTVKQMNNHVTSVDLTTRLYYILFGMKNMKLRLNIEFQIGTAHSTIYRPNQINCAISIIDSRLN